LGHARDFVDGRLVLSGDLRENVAKSDQGEKFLVKNVDEYINKAGLQIPEDELPVLNDAYQAVDIASLDLLVAGIGTIIWASGFKFDSSILRLPVLDEYGYPVTQHGVSAYPGLYFMGIPFLSKLKSGFIFGVSEDAAYISQHIANRA